MFLVRFGGLFITNEITKLDIVYFIKFSLVTNLWDKSLGGSRIQFFAANLSIQNVKEVFGFVWNFLVLFD